MNIKISITFLIIGSIGLAIALMVAFGVFDIDEILAVFFVSWFLVLGGSLFSLRVTAWALFLLGIYIFIFSTKLFEGAHFSSFTFIFMVVVLHIILGLILGINSFILHKKFQTPKLPKNPSR